MRFDLVYILLMITLIISLELFVIYKIFSCPFLLWNSNNQSRFCEFRDTPFISFIPNILSVDKCSQHCSNTYKCSHYSWFINNTCALKQGNISKANAVYTSNTSMWCGIVELKKSNIDRNLYNLAKCHFAYGRDYSGNGPDKSNYTNYDFVTIWLNFVSDNCRSLKQCTNFIQAYHGEMLKEIKKENKIPVFYSHMIASEAYLKKNLHECNTDLKPNLCQHGAQFIRNHREHILNRYIHYSYLISTEISRSAFCVFLIEPDFYQYYGSHEQIDGAMSGQEMRDLFDDIAKTIRDFLPNAAISWDVNELLSESELSDWWGYFANSTQIDFVYTSSGMSRADLKEVQMGQLKWKFISDLTGKKIIATSGYGDKEAIKSWYSIVNLRNLINQGVVGVALKQPFLNPVYRPSVC